MVVPAIWKWNNPFVILVLLICGMTAPTDIVTVFVAFNPPKRKTEVVARRATSLPVRAAC